MSFTISLLITIAIYIYSLPIHDHGIQRGLPRLIWAPAITYTAITLLHFTAGTSLLHCIQHCATRLQGTPCYSIKQNTVKHTICSILQTDAVPMIIGNTLQQSYKLAVVFFQTYGQFNLILEEEGGQGHSILPI